MTYAVTVYIVKCNVKCAMWDIGQAFRRAPYKDQQAWRGLVNCFCWSILDYIKWVVHLPNTFFSSVIFRLFTINKDFFFFTILPIVKCQPL
ncbi:hypothetical protein XELAEV_18030028mg [Xenopus laevis]|uniref:Uncharacterized protein n=1 Tax=Xenopus laevis TaxID=8355 RepID=A0A974CSL9_XENLA|nr:hypothetical protein XELAEV_18030028mg [Xenopus laevis]